MVIHAHSTGLINLKQHGSATCLARIWTTSPGHRNVEVPRLWGEALRAHEAAPVARCAPGPAAP
eukprot:1962718-Pyramimonas_sp.AAC.1